MARKNLDYITHHTNCRKLSLEIAHLGRSKYRGFNNANRDFDAKLQIRLIGQQAKECYAYQKKAPYNEKIKCKKCSVNPFTNWYKKHLVYK
jgi:hypothetical protein